MTKTKKAPKRRSSNVVVKQQSNKSKAVETQPGIYSIAKQLIPEGVKLLDAVKPGLGTIGSMVTKKAMDLFGRITGFGDYTIQDNSLIADPRGDMGLKPKFGKDAVRVRGSEFIEYLTIEANSGAFKQLYAFAINPCNSRIFPKLSVQARLYQKHKWHGLIFYADTACSKSISTTNGNMAIPTLIMCTLYNEREKVFVNEKSMMNSFFESDRPVNEDLAHPIECDTSTLQTPVFLNWANRPTGNTRDLALEHIGRLIVAQTGGSHTVAFKSHKFRVEYDVELIEPIYSEGQQLEEHYLLTGVNAGALFDSSVCTLANTSTTYGDPEKCYSLSGSTIVFEPTTYGNFMVDLTIKYSAAGVKAGGAWSSSLPTILLFDNDTQYYQKNIGLGETTSRCFTRFAFTVAGGGTVSLSDFTGTDFVSADLLISSIDNLSN